MIEIRLTERTRKDWTRHFVDETDYHTLLTEDATVWDPDGNILLIFLKNVIHMDLNLKAWSVLHKYNVKTDNRGVASGIKARPLKKLDGTLSKQTKVPLGWEVVSGVEGFFERTPRFPFCHATGWAQSEPHKFAQLIPLCERVNELFKEHLPERWAAQRAVADRVHPAWRIGNTVFSTLTINKNFRTAAHLDAGDLPSGFSALTVIRDGLYTGGHLCFPDFKVAADLHTGDCILFNPHEFHANTQIVPLTKNACRCSLVYYMREKMEFCGSPEAELEYAQNRKEGDPMWPERKS